MFFSSCACQKKNMKSYPAELNVISLFCEFVISFQNLESAACQVINMNYGSFFCKYLLKSIVAILVGFGLDWMRFTLDYWMLFDGSIIGLVLISAQLFILLYR